MSRLLALCLAGLVACANVPDYDDPRLIPDDDGGGDVVTCTNLLVNGAFDTTPVGWTFNPGDIVKDERQLPTDHPFYASSGDYFAWFGGSYNQTKIASQKITVPNTAKLKLTGKYFVAAVTTAGNMEDTVKLEIVDDAGKLLTFVTGFSNLDSVSETATFLWKDLHTEIPSQPFATKAVTFRITSVNDAMNNTNFLFDSLELKPTGCL